MFKHLVSECKHCKGELPVKATAENRTTTHDANSAAAVLAGAFRPLKPVSDA